MENIKKSSALKTAVLCLLAICVSAAAQTAGTFTDTRDGKTYRTAKIGEQVWMGENLNYKTPNGSWCIYNKKSNCKKYGRLYTWDAAVKACPVGWHLPDTSEWRCLVNFASGRDTAGAKLKSKPPNWDGTDEFGFSAMPGGYRDIDVGFVGLGSWGAWWSATEDDASNAYFRYMNTYMNTGNVYVDEYYYRKHYGFSVRCLRD
jgi:uncharacterized protein (TIGR02145 family)